MAVLIKMNSDDEYQLFSTLGLAVDGEISLLSKLKSKGIDLVKTADSLSFMEGKTMLQKVKFKHGLLTMVGKGLIGSYTKDVMAAEVKNAALVVLGEEVTKPTKLGDVPDWKKAEKKPKSKLTSESAHAEFKKAGSVMELLKDEPTPMNQAFQMYQPVKGTSGGSRYFTVAFNDDLVVAARTKTDRISVRVEARHGDLPSYEGKLKEAGFEMASQQHASIHLDIPNKQMAKRALGSLIMGLGVTFETEYPEVDVFWNKGN